MARAKRTRERWLTDAVDLIREEFYKGTKHKLPKTVAVSCGHTRGARAIGVCHPASQCRDNKTHHIFICPTQDDPMRVLDILLHETIHAALPEGTMHGKPFRDMADEFGLQGKPTATYCEPGTECYKRLKKIQRKLGKYPHRAIAKRREGPAKETKWKRFASINAENFKVVANVERVEEFGPPRDPWGDDMVQESD